MSGSLEAKRAQALQVTHCWWIDGCICRVPRKRQTEQRSPLTGDLQECFLNDPFLFLHYDSQREQDIGCDLPRVLALQDVELSFSARLSKCGMTGRPVQSGVCACRPAPKLSINWSCCDNLKVTDGFQEGKLEKKILHVSVRTTLNCYQMPIFLH